MTSSPQMVISRMPSCLTPISLSEIESVLSWVDSFKLSRPTKKINRDFSDAVLLAEILGFYYPKLVEMHNYPPRNSQALKMNNWMTLNRKVLKKLKLNLCTSTMEQLANCAPGVVERILVSVRDKIRRDEELIKASMKDEEQGMSSGGSYYEPCGDDEHVLIVPVKARVNGVLEIQHQKVVTYNAYLAIKEELKDTKDATEVLKQKVDHLENMMKLKEERIDELQKQLERKASRRKETEILFNSLGVPFDDSVSIVPKFSEVQVNAINKLSETSVNNSIKLHNLKNIPSYTKLNDLGKLDIEKVESKLSSQRENTSEKTISYDMLKDQNELKTEIEIEMDTPSKVSDIKVPVKLSGSNLTDNSIIVVESVKSEDLMQDGDQRNSDDEFKDSLQDLVPPSMDSITDGTL